MLEATTRKFYVAIMIARLVALHSRRNDPGRVNPNLSVVGKQSHFLVSTRRFRHISGVNYLLIHGGAHGAWCWEPLIAELTQRRHRGFALDLPGTKSNPVPPSRATTEACLQSVDAFLRKTRLRRFTLVGHSIAGFWLPAVAEKYASRITETIFLAAAVLAPGERGIDVIPKNRRSAYLTAGHNMEPCLSLLFPEARRRFFNDMPLPHARAAFSRLTPQSLLPYLTPAIIDPASLTGRKRYLLCRQDATFPPALARSFATKLNVVPEEIDAGHDVMLSCPRLLADHLLHS
ncbi:MAG: alpha/beta fold hydrolase [Limisphaerales bacterium]